MRRVRRNVLAVVMVGVVCAAWWPVGGWVNLFGQRELFRLGEAAGWTPTGPGARLAGQIMGFNHHEPRWWYDAVARSIAAAAALAPALLPALWLRRRMATGSAWVPATGWAWGRGAVCTLGAGVVFCVLDRLLAWEVWGWIITIGERLGGTVFRMSGEVGVGADGPFVGGATIDTIGNVAARHGPGVLFAMMAGVAAAALHGGLWRGDVRRAQRGTLCEKCGYDLSGIVGARVCPECGAGRAGISG